MELLFYDGEFGIASKNDIVPILGDLPNVMKKNYSLNGFMKLYPRLILYDVVIVPKLSYNLIVIAQLVKELNSIVVFNDHFCLMHNYTIRSLISIEQLDKVYVCKAVLRARVQPNAINL